MADDQIAAIGFVLIGAVWVLARRYVLKRRKRIKNMRKQVCGERYFIMVRPSRSQPQPYSADSPRSS